MLSAPSSERRSIPQLATLRRRSHCPDQSRRHLLDVRRYPRSGGSGDGEPRPLFPSTRRGSTGHRLTGPQRYPTSQAPLIVAIPGISRANTRIAALALTKDRRNPKHQSAHPCRGADRGLRANKCRARSVVCEPRSERVQTSAAAKGTAMLAGPDVDGWHRTICPACGYPSAGVCAACRQISPDVRVVPVMNTGVSQFDSAA
jgi:hypothetical protein